MNLITSRYGTKWAAPLLVLLLAALYAATALPGLGYTDDTAEFQLVGKVLGVPHLTGYPAYTVINHLFVTLFPFGEVPLKANLLSGLFTILAALVIFYKMKAMGIGTPVAFLVTSGFALNLSIWVQSIIAEVYSFNLLYVSLVFFFLLKWHQTRKNLHFYLALGCYAFSFGNHLTMITFLPAILYLLWVDDRSVFTDWRRIGWLTLLGLLAAAQYGYLFWRYYDPATPYLAMQTPTIGKLFWYLSGGHAKGMMFSYSLSQILVERIPLFARLFFREYGLLLAVAVYGFLRLQDRRWQICIALAFLGNVGYALNYRITDIYAYLLPSHMFLAVLLAYGCQEIIRKLGSRMQKWAVAALVLFPVINFACNLPHIRVVNRDVADPRVEETLQMVGRDALIVCPNSHHWHYFLYHVIAGDYQARNIHILPFDNAAKLHDYLYENRPLSLFETRTTLSPGMTVYFYDVPFTFRQTLQRDAYEMTAVTPWLYRMAARAPIIISEGGEN